MCARSFVVVLSLLAACGSGDRGAPPAAGSAAKAASAPPAAEAAEPPPDGVNADALGSLHFDISGGTPEARRHFDIGLLALHSFWYDEAQREFQRAIDADPSFSMAYWGLAMSHAKLLWDDDDIAAGQDALRRMPSPQQLPPHDQAWVMAAVALFRDPNADPHAARRAFLAVMEQLHAQFPDDESALFLALALLSTIEPGDPNEEQIRRRAGALAAEVFAHNPKHPGAAHYLIHAYDTPTLAPLALPAARVYAQIAPAAYHAQHMPAHVFVRLGMWKDAAASCQAAWDASVAWVRRDHLSIDHEDFHSLSWLIEIDFERGRRKDAEAVMKQYGDLVRAGLPHAKRAAYANQVASVLARSGEWNRIDELLAPLDTPATDDGSAAGAAGSAGSAGRATGGGMAGMPGMQTTGPTALFERRAVLGTRAEAAAMRRDRAQLEKLLAERDAVDAQLHAFLVATQGEKFVASVDSLRGQVRAALEARARGDDRGLVDLLRPLATDQETTFTGEGMTGGILRSEQIADELLRIGKAREALAQYRAVLARHAGRARSLLGAARAAMRTGDATSAHDYYKQLLNIWGEADPDTDGLDEVKRNAR